MACGSCAQRRKSTGTYEARFPDGTTKVFATEYEAKAAVARKGGTVRRSS